MKLFCNLPEISSIWGRVFGFFPLLKVKKSKTVPWMFRPQTTQNKSKVKELNKKSWKKLRNNKNIDRILLALTLKHFAEG